jgi:AcrR family transcriptional regulator
MSTKADGRTATAPGHTRRRGSEETRARLLAAAGELFAERGYVRTTVRDIGQHADVDPALIARYFGSKATLYLEALRPQGHWPSVDPLDLTDADVVRRLLERVGPAGPSPTLHAAVRPHEDAALQAAAMEFIKQRLLSPTERHARDAGLDHAKLRAEVAVAALAGVVISRTTKAFPTLARASSADVGRLIASPVGDVIDAAAS